MTEALEHATLRLRQRKTPELKVSETVAHNSVFASIPDASGSGKKIRTHQAFGGIAQLVER
jgi:hypothetical protein